MTAHDWANYQRVVPPSLLKHVKEHLYKEPVLLQPVLSEVVGLVPFLVENLDYQVVRP